MDSKLSDKISKYVSSNVEMTIKDFFDYDSPTYEMTVALVTALVGHPVTLQKDTQAEFLQVLSQDGTILLCIEQSDNKYFSIMGLFAEDIMALLVAIRIHEVESYELVYLPPNIREARIEKICRDYGVNSKKINRLTNIWMDAK